MTIEQLAQQMFRAYNDQGPNPWKTFDGRSVPSWDELGDQVKAKWCAAAAVPMRAIDVATEMAAMAVRGPPWSER